MLRLWIFYSSGRHLALRSGLDVIRLAKRNAFTYGHRHRVKQTTRENTKNQEDIERKQHGAHNKIGNNTGKVSNRVSVCGIARPNAILTVTAHIRACKIEEKEPARR